MRMNDERVQFKLSSNEWDEVKGKSHPRKCWFVQREVLQIKLIKGALDLCNLCSGKNIIEKKFKKEYYKLVISLQHRSKFCAYKELKWEVQMRKIRRRKTQWNM